MTELRTQRDEAVAFLRTRTAATPAIGIILGTGLGGLVKEIQVQTVIDYGDIPHFPVSTVESHHGKLIFGTLGKKQVVAMQGRFHYYEGYTMKQITYPVRVMKALGVKVLVVSNACGCVNPQYRAGDLMIMDDHINLLGDNPLIGPNHEDFGPRFPDMSEPYSRRLIEIAEKVAMELKIKVHRGTYLVVSGPNLETRAEYRMMRLLGADVVGMSSVPECIVAKHGGMECFGMSIITDEGFADCLKPADIPHILQTAAAAEPKMTAIMKGLVGRM